MWIDKTHEIDVAPGGPQENGASGCLKSHNLDLCASTLGIMTELF